MLIIGITGTIGAGKGTVVDYLVSQEKFKHSSARGFLTEEIIKRGLAVNRDNMKIVADDLRKKYSAGYIVEKLLENAKLSKSNDVIESIRTTGEVDYMRKNCPEFVLLAVDADPKIRYERVHKRQSSTDNVSFEKFMAQELAESLSEVPTEMNLPKCIALSDFKIINNGSMEELETQIKNFLEEIRKRK